MLIDHQPAYSLTMSSISQDHLSSETMLRESGEAILESGLFSDVVVKCKDRVWRLHKSIICPRCPYFSKAFNGQFMEATTGELTLQDQVPSNVDQVVRYLYTGQVSKDFVEEDPCQLFKLADFFQIASLVKEIVSITNTKLNGMADRLRNMPQPDTELRSIFSDEEVDYLFRVIETSYEEVPVPYVPLRDLIKDFMVKSEFLLTKTDRFLATIERIPGLALDIMRLLRYSAIVNEHPQGCKKCRGKISRNGLRYLWMKKNGSAAKDSGAVKYTLHALCKKC